MAIAFGTLDLLFDVDSYEVFKSIDEVIEGVVGRVGVDIFVVSQGGKSILSR